MKWWWILAKCVWDKRSETGEFNIGEGVTWRAMWCRSDSISAHLQLICNSFFHNLPCRDHLLLILNSTDRDFSKTPRFSYIIPNLKSLHWHTIAQRIQYKALSLLPTKHCTLKNLHISTSLSICKLTPNRSSSVITLQRPTVNFRLKITLLLTFLLSPHLSFTPNLLLISFNNHSLPSIFAPSHFLFSGSFDLA